MKNALKTLIFLSLAGDVAAHHFTWPRATPEDVNLNPDHIQSAISQIESGTVGQIRSLLIIKDGQLVTERYFGTNGEKRPVYSVTKSVGSALLGIAKQQGSDVDPDNKLLDYFPQYLGQLTDFQTGQLNQVKLHDLLTQRHGYSWDEWSTPFSDLNHPVTQILRSNDWYLTALAWPITEPPDQNFTYSTGHSSLMSMVLLNTTGRDVYDFAQQELFTPLNITDTHWELIVGGGTQGQGTTDFPFDLEPLGFGLWMKPIDMAKIGELYRLGGLWEDQRLLSEEWIQSSVQRYSDGNTDADVFPNEYSGYGYQWWVIRMLDSSDRIYDMYYANGYGRQYIFVIPEHETVIVSTAEDFFYDGPGLGTVMRQNLLNAFPDINTTMMLTHDLNGSWYDPNNNGQGINIEIIDANTRVNAFWYTYEVEGGKQRWFSLQGTVLERKGLVTIYSTTGGGFVEADTEPELINWGNGEFEFTSCSSGVFRFDSPIEDVQGEILLTRLTTSSGACADPPSPNKNKRLEPSHPMQLK